MGPLIDEKRRRLFKQQVWWATYINNRNKGKSCEESRKLAYRIAGFVA